MPRRLVRALSLISVFLAIEAMDEVIFGAREAAWPVMRRDLGLSYVQIGILLALPGLIAAFVEPVFGLLADAGHRRLIVVLGGCAFAAGLVVSGLASAFTVLLIGFLVIYPASGAFVALSQASLMDLQPGRQEVNMARWTLAGSVGAVVGPLLLTGALALGVGWRVVFMVTAAALLPLILLARSMPFSTASHESFHAALRGLHEALRRREVLRWLTVVELTDLMGDVLLGYLALYFVDVVGLSPVAAGGVVIVWTVAGLIGDALLLVILGRMSGVRHLRLTAVLALMVFPAFLLVPAAPVKTGLIALIALLHAGWYAIPQGRLYSEMDDKSGTAMALSSLATALGTVLPFAMGLLAQRVGLEAALWLSMLAPLALLLFTGGAERSGTSQES